jgi:cytochrome c biogenesis protein CcmG/thiol:disulfide interchange protein DsbE
MMRALLPLGLFLLIGIAFAIGLTKDPRRMSSELINRPFPEFSLPELYDEDAILTEDIVKGQVSLVNVFGSWCVACNVEHPTLMDIAKRREVTLIGMDWRDERPKAKKWLAERGNPYDKIIFDNESTLAITLGVTGAPESFITDRTGQIRYKHVGVITPEIWRDTLKPIIQKLEAE